MKPRLFHLFFVAVLLNANIAASEDTRGVVYKPSTGQEKGLEGETRIYSNSHAVVIGIDDYDDETINDLSGAVRDAQNIAKTFEKRGMEVKLFINGAATLDALREYLGDILATKVEENDRVIVYFAGHGVSVGTGNRAMGYLLPVDAKRSKPKSSGISMRELQSWFSDYTSKHVMFVADACYSGLALNTRSVGLESAIRDYLKRITSKPARLAIVAGSDDEEAHEWRGEGLFTHYFIEAIDGAADANHDGLITSDEIAAYVKPNVSQKAMSEYGAEQNPQMGREGQGEFVFLNPLGTALNCPSGTKEEAGKCVPLVSKNCAVGMTFVEGRGCVAQTDESCPSGMEFTQGKGCVAIVAKAPLEKASLPPEPKTADVQPTTEPKPQPDEVIEEIPEISTTEVDEKKPNRKLLITLFTVGGTTLAAGGILGGVVLGKAGNIKDHCNLDTKQCDPGWKDEYDTAQKLGISSTVLVTTGLATIATGIIVKLLGGKKEVRARVMPVTGPGFAGLSIKGRF